jgi:hypothetical protein
MSIPTLAERLRALVLLGEMGSHDALTQEDVTVLNEGFGTTLTLAPVPANVHFKGYLNPDLEPGTIVQTMGAWEAAEEIAGTLGWKGTYVQGRGGRFRAARQHIQEHYRAQQAQDGGAV